MYTFNIFTGANTRGRVQNPTKIWEKIFLKKIEFLVISMFPYKSNRLI